MIRQIRTCAASVALVLAGAGCSSSPPPDEAKAAGRTVADYPLAAADFFSEMDRVPTLETPEPVPFDPQTEAQAIQGRNAWLLWCGGNEAFWDWLARYGYGTLDLLRLVDSNNRGTRFAEAGLITEPDTVPPTPEETEQAFGIRYDRSHAKLQPDPRVYGYSSGVVGLRLFPNPEFNGAARARWDAARYYSDPDYAANPATIRPFRVGMSCGFCHVGPHPLYPPADRENPKWENLSSTIGNQYMRVRAVFGNRLTPDNLLYHVLDSQLPGTIDTSLIAADNINNPNTMNAIFGVPWRLERAAHNPPEYQHAASAIYPSLTAGDAQPASVPRFVPRVLLDGSDSVGVILALARVYLNIGTYYEQWNRLHNPLLGFRSQTPFKAADCEANSVYWAATMIRLEPMIAFFTKRTEPMRLRDAPGGREKVEGEGVPWDPAYQVGRAVFARGCIACHSSVQPGVSPSLDQAIAQAGGPPAGRVRPLRLEDLSRLTRGDGALPPAYAQWAQHAVERQEFWTKNYLSTDQRIPVTLLRTNSARALATNALTGHMWEDFSSHTYQSLGGVGSISYRDPFSGAERAFAAADDGPGYYRVPSLISIWAAAPFLHNNALGDMKVNDPSVEGRLAVFHDAIEKLLWPERRLPSGDDPDAQQRRADHGLIWRTSADSWLRIPGYHVPQLASGFTGLTLGQVGLLAWAPTLLFLLLGAVLLTSSPVKRRMASRMGAGELDRLAQRVRRWIGAFALLLAGLAFFAAWYVHEILEILEMMMQARWPVYRVQAWLPGLFLLLVGLYLIGDWFPIRSLRTRVYHVLGAVSLLAAAIAAAGFGRALAGHGSGITFGPLPKGIPVNVLANMDPEAPLADRKAAVEALFAYFRGERSREAFEQSVAPALMKASKCPDFVLDRGHDFNFFRDWSDADKEALIKLLRTF